MRTTVTLDEDVERLLRQTMHRSRRSFKETLNAAVRAALGARPAAAGKRPFVVTARPMGLRAGLDPTGFNKLVDELGSDTFLEKHRRGRRA